MSCTGPEAASRAAPRLLLAGLVAAAMALPAGARGEAGPPRPPPPVAPLPTVPSPADKIPGTEGGPADTLPAPGDTLPSAGDTLPPGAGSDTLPADSLPGIVPDSLARLRAAEAREGLAGGGFPARDSLFRRLAEMPGFRKVEYRGREVELEVGRRRIHLRDSAQTNYADAALTADTIIYRARIKFVEARGGIKLVSPSRREMTSDSVLYYDVSSRKGTVLGAQTEFSQRGATWQVSGNAVPVGEETVYVRRGNFSSCRLEEPHYYFKADKIKMVSQDVIVAWPVVLYISKVPVFWLPFFAQDIRPDRRSGILPPRFGFNDVVRTSRGMDRQIQDFGYYWAISRFMDAQATMDWFSGNYTRLNGAFRYRFRKSFIRGNARLSQEWGETGKNLQATVNHEQELSPDTDVRVRANFVQSTERFQERTFDPELQTQTIDSDVGIRHRFSFADLSASARRRQFLGQNEQTTLTLPDVRLSFSPVTILGSRSPRGGAFSNLIWNGSMNFTREDRSQALGDDLLTTNGGLNQSFRLGDLGLATQARFDDRRLTPVRRVITGDSLSADTTFRDLATSARTTAEWSAGTSYQIDLMGSTALRPRVQVSGGWFRSSVPGDSVPDTGDAFVSTPTRGSFGASLSTDLFGFFPGFGAFSRIRHKVSPSVEWSYSPAVKVSPSRAQIPGFPGGAGAAQNQLRFRLNQTFEAKKETRGGAEDGPEEGGEAVPADTLPSDTLPAEAAGEAPAAAGAEGGEGEKVTLLAIRSDPLVFDFEAAKRGEPLLVTDRFGNSIRSDLLRGLTLNIEHDLFEGSGPDRTFSPFLSRVNASFSFSSGQGLGGLVGVGDGGPPSPREVPGLGGGLDARAELSDFERGGETRERPEERGGGPWRLSLNYSLLRRRAPLGDETTNQTLSGSLDLQPTPNWTMQWSTSYSFTDNEFGRHTVRLDRDLHRWRASFVFAKAPNGNFLFQFRVNLTDAPELKVDYDQRSEPRR